MDPCNYNEVIQDKDATLWQKAMKIDVESMYSNQVWFFVSPLDAVKPIGYKWIYQEGENLSDIASGEGVTTRKKVFNTFQPVANNLLGFSHPLYLTGTIGNGCQDSFP